jgi:hypothetical protein
MFFRKVEQYYLTILVTFLVSAFRTSNPTVVVSYKQNWVGVSKACSRTVTYFVGYHEYLRS